MQLIPSRDDMHEEILSHAHEERMQIYLEKDVSIKKKCSLPSYEIEQIKKLEKDAKDQILVDFISSESIESDKHLIAIIISLQYLFENYQIELAIKTLFKCLQNNVSYDFEQGLVDKLVEDIIQFNQEEKSEMILKCICIINILLKKYSKNTNAQFISELVDTNYSQIILNCDMKLPEIACSLFHLLQIQFKDHSPFCDKIYDDKELKLIMKNCIDILNSIFISSSEDDKHSCQEVQFEKQKYLFKCTSIFPHDFDFDCLLIDLMSEVVSSNSSFEIKEIAIKSLIKRNIKSMGICNGCFDVIKKLISDIEANGKADQISDKLFLSCVNYLNISFDCWFDAKSESSSKNLEIIISIIEYIIDNKSFKFVESILPVTEKIINRTHLINMKIEEMLINHIDSNEIGKICLITSFMATENMSSDQFIKSLNMYIDIYQILDNLYNSEQCDQMTSWIIEAIWESIARYYVTNLEE